MRPQQGASMWALCVSLSHGWCLFNRWGGCVDVHGAQPEPAVRCAPTLQKCAANTCKYGMHTLSSIVLFVQARASPSGVETLKLCRGRHQ